GEFKSNRALPVLIATTRPFEVFQTQCHVETGSKLIVTAADPSRRLVMGFNGDNAASEYAEAIGVPVEELSTSVFANNPLVLRASGVAYARSVIAANPDGSLLFGCAIDQGIVLSVGKMGDMVGDLSAKLGVLRARVGEPALTICCDCAHRRMVARETQVTKEIGDVLRDFRAVGFCSYGEQYKGIHTNSALVGVMIGK
ncbi:MAG: FIST C-terminal domain-containing protein, partial [Polyangiaceae bacterium]|nr:FIST C-terminal domain-containing protein [Polyangiaceae bacterium]